MNKATKSEKQKEHDRLWRNPEKRLETFLRNWRATFPDRKLVEVQEDAGEESQDELWADVIRFLQGEYATNPCTTLEETIRDIKQQGYTIKKRS